MFRFNMANVFAIEANEAARVRHRLIKLNCLANFEREKRNGNFCLRVKFKNEFHPKEMEIS